MKAYSYIRFSSREQLTGDSYRRQSSLSAKYCEDNNLELDTSFNLNDLGVSAYDGSNLDTGNLGHFIEAINKGKIERGSVLLVESLDRLSRDKIMTAFSLFSTILEKDIKIVTLADGIEYTKDSVNDNFGNLVISLTIMSRAHEESKIKSQRIIAAWDRKVQEKIDNIDGKIVTSRCPYWLKPNEKKNGFDKIDDRVEVVNRIFQMSIEGHGTGLITKVLNMENVPRFGKSKLWHQSYVKKILNNRSVLGEFHPRKKGEPIGEVIKDYFPRIISNEIFYASLQSMKGRKLKSGRKTKKPTANLFTHIIKCGYCGESFVYVNKGKKSSGPCLVCNGARSGNGCQYKSWNYAQFESSFLMYISELNITEILSGDDVQKKEAEIKLKESSLQGERDKNICSMEKLTSLILESEGLTMDVYHNKNKEYALRNLEIDQELESIKREMREISLMKPNIVGKNLDEIKDMLGELEESNRGRLATEIKRMIKRIHLFPAGSTERVASGIQEYHTQLFAYSLSKRCLHNSPKLDKHFFVEFNGNVTKLVEPSTNYSTPMFFTKPLEIKDDGKGGAYIDLW